MTGPVESQGVFDAHPDDKCECGHTAIAHPYVGRIASWPTRCYYCDCLGWKPIKARETA